jgi:Tol biopolymer transport system component
MPAGGLARFPAVAVLVLAVVGSAPAATPPAPLIGYTELRTDLTGGRHANVRTMRAVVVGVDGAGRRVIAEDLARQDDSWTQFAGWSPDGRTAVVGRGWESPENARWEEQHQQFRHTKEGWLLDTYLVDLDGGTATNVTAVDRVSHHNGGLFFLPGGGLGFTPLIDGRSKPYVMDRDGRNKRDVSGQGGGFAYGYSAAPDGKRISYHEDYQVYVADADGSGKKRLDTGKPFNFAPRWSPDGRWLLFLSGTHYDCHPYLARPDGTGLRKLADRGGYRGVVEFLDVPDFHGGSSDTPVWSPDGKWVYFTAAVGKSVELFRATPAGEVTRLTRSPDGTLHYHPQPSPDGDRLAYGSKRDGVRQLYVLRLADRAETRLTDLKAGHAAMWPHWRPTAGPRGPAPDGPRK